MKTYAIDLDGCIVDFNNGYRDLIKQMFDLDLPAIDDTYPTTWNYHEDVGLGVEKGDQRLTDLWHRIMHSDFWETLKPYPESAAILRKCALQRGEGDYLYFVTSRPGQYAKHLTEFWLDTHGFACPTVIIASKKGPVCASLGANVIIDDKIENCTDVALACPRSQVILLDRPYNRSFDEQAWNAEVNANPFERERAKITRITSLLDPRVFTAQEEVEVADAA